jgi:NADH:quinone reductase (non-electrogenic)
VVAIERRPGGAVFEDIRELVAGVRGREALGKGDVDGGIITAGIVVGLINDIPTCAELLDRMVRECRQHLSGALSFLPAA